MTKKQKILNVLFIICMFFCLSPMTVFADNISDSQWNDYAASEFGGGSGTKTDPYLISTAEQLAKISKDVSNGNEYKGQYFKLEENIDLSEHRWNPIGIYKVEPDGTTTNKSFDGFIDGNNKVISGLIVDEQNENCAGFFGYICNTGENTVGAKNLTISNASINANGEELGDLYMGILAGFAMANPNCEIVFENITVSGSVTIQETAIDSTVGGMLGYADRVKVMNCKAENISIPRGNNIGGFVGMTGGSLYENCSVSGSITGDWCLGGFVGYTNSVDDTLAGQSVFKKCTTSVSVISSDWRIGGFAGLSEYGNYQNCVAYGDVNNTVTSFNPKVGGFIGESDSDTVVKFISEVSDSEQTKRAVRNKQELL